MSPPPTSRLPSVNTFGELSHFLRSAVADEDSRIFSESMGHPARMRKPWWRNCARAAKGRWWRRC
ncbi:hypothetical protein HK414_21030 [Ramlibacter terrae]|uniref:Uncharacterized protein n=1 Tax=Ramlibacter terrae TaxID=2732511 RepID=A0ABX6P4S8_9BURK|nr:hypothetical protein HK414_21030 [Ramlibacter terrae]